MRIYKMNFSEAGSFEGDIIVEDADVVNSFRPVYSLNFHTNGKHLVHPNFPDIYKEYRVQGLYPYTITKDNFSVVVDSEVVEMHDQYVYVRDVGHVNIARKDNIIIFGGDTCAYVIDGKVFNPTVCFNAVTYYKGMFVFGSFTSEYSWGQEFTKYLANLAQEYGVPNNFNLDKRTVFWSSIKDNITWLLEDNLSIDDILTLFESYQMGFINVPGKSDIVSIEEFGEYLLVFTQTDTYVYRYVQSPVPTLSFVRRIDFGVKYKVCYAGNEQRGLLCYSNNRKLILLKNDLSYEVLDYEEIKNTDLLIVSYDRFKDRWYLTNHFNSYVYHKYGLFQISEFIYGTFIKDGKHYIIKGESND
jgi:hypothetical protein